MVVIYGSFENEYLTLFILHSMNMRTCTMYMQSLSSIFQQASRHPPSVLHTIFFHHSFLHEVYRSMCWTLEQRLRQSHYESTPLYHLIMFMRRWGVFTWLCNINSHCYAIRQAKPRFSLWSRNTTTHVINAGRHKILTSRVIIHNIYAKLIAGAYMPFIKSPYCGFRGQN